MASPLTALGTTNCWRMISWDSTTWANICAGAGVGKETPKEYFTFGSYYTAGPYYEANTACLEFDTSSIGASSTVTAVVLSLWGANTGPAQAFEAQVKAYDYGTDIEAGDWRTPTQFAALTTLATLAVPGDSSVSTVAYTPFTSNGNFAAAINKTGLTRLIINSDRFAASTQPSSSERLPTWIDTTSGKEPKLVVTYTELAFLTVTHRVG